MDTQPQAPAVDPRAAEDHWRDDIASLNGDLTAALAPPPLDEDRPAGPHGLLPYTYSIVIVMEDGPYDPHVAARPADMARVCHDSVIVRVDPHQARLSAAAAARLRDAWQQGNPCCVVAHPQSHVEPEQLLDRILEFHPTAHLDPPLPWAAQRLPDHLDLRRTADPIALSSPAALPDDEEEVRRYVDEGKLVLLRRASGPEWLVAHLGTAPEGAGQWAWTPIPDGGDGGVAGGEALWPWRTGPLPQLRQELGRGELPRDPWLYHAVAAGLRPVWHPARPRAGAHCGYHYQLPSLEAWLLTHVPAWSWTEHLHFAGTTRDGGQWEGLARPDLEARVRDWTLADGGTAP